MNAFEDLADRQTPRAVKKRQARSEPQIKKDKEKKALSKAYQRLQQEKLDEALAGPWGYDLYELRYFLACMSPDDAEQLIECVSESKLIKAPEDIRYIALRLIDEAICALRDRAGLTPVEDSLPGEEPTAFEIIKGVLFP
jgi:hypothetical protein